MKLLLPRKVFSALPRSYGREDILSGYYYGMVYGSDNNCWYAENAGMHKTFEEAIKAADDCLLARGDVEFVSEERAERLKLLL